MGLEVKNITKSYGENVVVDDLSFEMKTPGVYALLGRNGAGKTTTIRIILGMLASDSGQVLWDGKVMDPLNVNVGYLAEERGLYPKYTLMDQLIYFAKLKNIDEKEARKRIKYWSGRLELDEYIYPTTDANSKKKAIGRKNTKGLKSRKADQLSKGNQQKVQLMASLLSDPDIIILDEPLSGLDPVNADLFKEIIKECIDKEKYLIMSSHQMPTIEEFCTDITILNRGKAVCQGNLNEIKKSYGRVNMFVKCEEDISQFIEEGNLNVLEETPDGYHIKVSGEQESKDFLKRLIDNNITVIKFELREPSLHEIFVEKVGGNNE